MKRAHSHSGSFSASKIGQLPDHRYTIALIFLTIAGIVLRLWRFDQGFIFAFDQARDAYRSVSIYSQHHLMILGPETDIPGVFHGVGYYYILGLFYWIFKSPSGVGKIFAIINAVGILLTYLGGIALFKNRRTAIISALLYAVSFEVVQYSRWLSNPAPGLLAVIAVYIGAWMWIKGNQNGLVLSIAGIALGMHFQFILVYLLIVPIVVWIIYRPKTHTATLLVSLCIFLIFMSTFIAAEFKFGHATTHGLWSYFFGSEKRAFDAYQTYLRLWNRTSSAAYFSLFPISKIVAIILQLFIFIAGFITYRKTKSITSKPHPFPFLMLWYFMIFPLYIFSAGASNSEFSFVSSIPALLYICAYYIDQVYQTGKTRTIAFIVLGVIVLLNIRMVITQSDRGSYALVTHIGMTYAREKQLLDYVYTGADKKSFSLCTLTNPLFINSAWAYLFSTYGQNMYGYLPFWAGSDQTNYPV
jgi:4-amino-4-deoxy-L-arabinose transferase-like glycosyltransferase